MNTYMDTINIIIFMHITLNNYENPLTTFPKNYFDFLRNYILL